MAHNLWVTLWSNQNSNFLIRSFAVKNSKDIFPNSFKNTKLFVELIWISSTSCQGHPINKLYFVCLIENELKLKMGLNWNGLKLDRTWVQKLYLVWSLNPKVVLKECRRKVKTVEHPFLSNSKNHYGDSEMYVQTDKRSTEKSFFEKTFGDSSGDFGTMTHRKHLKICHTWIHLFENLAENASRNPEKVPYGREENF